MKVIIVTAGNFNMEELEGRDYDILIGVDGGCDYLVNSKYMPDVVIGDFDSVTKEVIESLKNNHVKILEFNPDKDMTDTHIAIEYALDEGATELVILGATGTRLDHTFANVFLLEKYSKKAKCKIVDHNNQIYIISDNDCIDIKKKVYKYVSLVPISNKVLGVTTTGLKYALKDATLKRSDSYGISNELNENSGSVKVKEGVLAVIQSRD